MIVERVVPEKFLNGLKEGIYKLYGGTIHNVKTGKIVGHLSLGNEKVIQSMRMFNHLSGATVALSALNLGVSIVGFSIVISQLNKLDKKLYKMEELLQKILKELSKLKYLNQLKEISKIIASLEDLEYGLKTKNKNLIDDTFRLLNQSLKLRVLFIGIKIQNLAS